MQLRSHGLSPASLLLLLSGCLLGGDETSNTEYFRLLVTGNAYGTVVFARESGEFWYQWIGTTGDGGGPYSGVEAISPYAGSSPPLKFQPPSVGQEWKSSGVSGDSRGSYRIDSSCTITSVSEEVTVSAGTFAGCAKVVETLTYPSGYFPGQRHPVRFERWFAPGIGPVKVMITEDDDGTLAGELTAFETPGAAPQDYFPLELDFTWSFALEGGRSASWAVSDAWKD